MRVRAWLLGAGLALGVAAAATTTHWLLRRPAAADRRQAAAGEAHTAAAPAAFGAIRAAPQGTLNAIAATFPPQQAPSGTAVQTAGGSPATGAAALGGPAVRRVEESATLTVRVQGVASAFESLTSLAVGLGGYVQSSDLQTGSGGGASSSSATVVVAVPQAQYAGFLRQAGALGKVLRSSATGQDVTQQYVDLQGRLTALKSERQSYLTLLGKATSVGDILQIQSALTDVEAQIEDITGQIDVLDALSAMATVTVDLVPPAAPAPPPPHRPTPLERISAAFATSVHALTGGATALALALAWALPWAALATGAVIAFRRFGRRGARA